VKCRLKRHGVVDLKKTTPGRSDVPGMVSSLITNGCGMTKHFKSVELREPIGNMRNAGLEQLLEGKALADECE